MLFADISLLCRYQFPQIYVVYNTVIVIFICKFGLCVACMHNLFSSSLAYLQIAPVCLQTCSFTSNPLQPIQRLDGNDINVFSTPC